MAGGTDGPVVAGDFILDGVAMSIPLLLMGCLSPLVSGRWQRHALTKVLLNDSAVTSKEVVGVR